jgi:hypothetical protein
VVVLVEEIAQDPGDRVALEPRHIPGAVKVFRWLGHFRVSEVLQAVGNSA